MRNFAFVMLAGIAGAAHAQTAPRPDPSDPQVRVPPPQYRSAFSEYQLYRNPEIANWREANEKVKEGGGHAGHGTKPAAKPDAKADAKPAAPQSKPPSGGHAGH
jgi:hypothetical protein